MYVSVATKPHLCLIMERVWIWKLGRGETLRVLNLTVPYTCGPQLDRWHREKNVRGVYSNRCNPEVRRLGGNPLSQLGREEDAEGSKARHPGQAKANHQHHTLHYTHLPSSAPTMHKGAANGKGWGRPGRRSNISNHFTLVSKLAWSKK